MPRRDSGTVRSDRQPEFVECGGQLEQRHGVDGQLVVAPAKVLDERVPTDLARAELDGRQLAVLELQLEHPLHVRVRHHLAAMTVHEAMINPPTRTMTRLAQPRGYIRPSK